MVRLCPRDSVQRVTRLIKNKRRNKISDEWDVKRECRLTLAGNSRDAYLFRVLHKQICRVCIVKVRDEGPVRDRCPRWPRKFVGSFMSRRTIAISFHQHSIHGVMRHEWTRESHRIRRSWNGHRRKIVPLFTFLLTQRLIRKFEPRANDRPLILRRLMKVKREETHKMKCLSLCNRTETEREKIPHELERMIKSVPMFDYIFLSLFFVQNKSFGKDYQASFSPRIWWHVMIYLLSKTFIIVWTFSRVKKLFQPRNRLLYIRWEIFHYYFIV